LGLNKWWKVVVGGVDVKLFYRFFFF